MKKFILSLMMAFTLLALGTANASVTPSHRHFNAQQFVAAWNGDGGQQTLASRSGNPTQWNSLAPKHNREALYECGFEEELTGWTFVDADGDGFNWVWQQDYSNPPYCTAYEGEGLLYSQSYDNDGGGALTPDNWAISPAVELPAGSSHVALYACGQDASYADEHFQLYAGTTNDINEMTAISDEFVATGDYTRYEGDLSAFAGQTVYVAIRHFNVTDMFYLNVDNFSIIGGEPEPEPEPVLGFYFETEGDFNEWSLVDSDGDGYNWAHGTTSSDAHTGTGCAYSASYFSGTYKVALSPDNWIISPAIEVPDIDPSLTFWTKNYSSSYQDHIAAYVGTSTDIEAMTEVLPEFLPSGGYTQYTIDLADYAGQTVYFAVRHFNCTDCWRVMIDDVEVWGEYEEGPEPELGEATFTVTAPETVAPGEEFDVEVSISGDYEAHTLTYFFNYDADAFEFQSKTNGEVLETINSGDANMVMFNTATAGRLRLGIVCGEDAFSEEGVLFTATFIAKEDATAGSYTFENEIETFSYAPVNGTETDVPFTTVDGTVEITGGEEPDPYVITEVNVDGFLTEIYAGQTVADMVVNLTVPEGVNYDISSIFVYDMESPVELDEETVLEEGHSYQVGVMVEADLDYSFSTDAVLTANGGTELLDDEYTGLEGSSVAWIVTNALTCQAAEEPLSDLDEALNVEGGTLHFESEGAYPWIVVTEGDRMYAKSSNGGVGSSTSTLTTTVTLEEDGLLQFEFMAWGEGSSSYWDHCDFYVDGERELYYGAYDNDWEAFSVELTAGEHTLTWSYTKDSSVNATGDYFAVDNVSMEESEPELLDLEGEIVIGEVSETGFVTVEYTGEEEVTLAATLDGDPVEFTRGGVQLPDYGTYQLAVTASAEGYNALTAEAEVEWAESEEPEPVAENFIQGFYFEDDGDNEWINYVYTVDQDGDGNGWGWYDYEDYAYEGSGFMASQSYSSSDGALTPDNWLLFGPIQLRDVNNSVTFYASGYEDWYMEHFAAYAMTEENFDEWNPDDWTEVLEETEATDEYVQYTADLDDFAGESIYIAIRHFNCTDQYYLFIDQLEFWGEYADEPVVALEGVTIVPESAELMLYDVQEFTFSVIPEDAEYSSYEWSVDDESVLTIDQDGVAEAIGAGNAVVTITVTDATGATFSASADVSVQEEIIELIDFTGYIEFGDPDENGYVSIEYVDGDEEDYDIIVYVDGEIAELDEDGNIQLPDYGTYTIEVTLSAPGYNDYYQSTEVEWTNGEEPAAGLIWDFETDPEAQGWTFEDRDGDGYNWEWHYIDYTDWNYHEGLGFMASQSYVNYVGPLTPDNWAISPYINILDEPSVISLWAEGQDPSWSDEVFAVYVIANGEEIQIGDDITATGEDTEYTFDISDYAGQTVRFAIRHYNCTDMFWLNVDYVTVSNAELAEEPELLDLEGEIVIGEVSETGFVTVEYTGDEEVTLAATLDGDPVEFTRGGVQLPDYGTYQLAVTASAEGYNDLTEEAEVEWIEPVIPAGDLDEALNVEGGTLHFESEGDYPWIVVTEGDRMYAMSSNAGVGSSTSTLTTTVTAEEGDLVQFEFKAWGEGSYTFWDHCDFLVDGTQMFTYGAYDNDWEVFSVELTAGEHTLTWSYTKDSSVNPTGDYFAVDNVSMEESEPELLDLEGEIVIGDVTEEGLVNIAYDGDEDVTITVLVDGEEVELDEDGNIQLPEYGEYEISVTVSAEGYNDLLAESIVEWTEPVEPLLDLEGEIVIGEVTEEGLVNIAYDGDEDVTITVLVDGEEVELDEDGNIQLPEYGEYEISVTVSAEGYNDLTEEAEVEWAEPVEPEPVLTTASVNVLLNSADSPEGIEVTFSGTEEYTVTLDETGHYDWDEIYTGTYTVTIEKDGYYTINDEVEITEDGDNDFRYVMVEIWYPITGLYVSQTGWATWKGYFPAEGRHLEEFKVMCTSIDGEPIFTMNTTNEFCQLDVTTFEAGHNYICKVAATYSTGISEWVETEWKYMPCDEFEGTQDGVTLEETEDGNVISWTYPEIELSEDPDDALYAWTFEEEEDFLEWDNVDANGDGVAWEWSMNSDWDELRPEAYEGTGFIFSRSYTDHPIEGVDNWFVSPVMENLPGRMLLSYFVAPQDVAFAYDHYGVYVITENDSTLIFDETLTAGESGKGGSISKNGKGGQGTYERHILDLREFAGQDIQIAFRHFDCYDAFWFKIDLVAVAYENVIGAMIFRDGEYLAFTEDDSYTDEEGGQHEYCVRIVYGGPAELPVDNIFFSMSCPECVNNFDVPVESIVLDPDHGDLLVGETLTFTATVLPEDATLQELIWTISDETVISFAGTSPDEGEQEEDQEQNDRTESKTVTALAPGTATVTVTTFDGEITAEATVTVTEPEPVVIPVASITIDPETVELEIGETAEFTATVLPEDATNQEVVWSIEPETVATIDENGVVTAVAAGEATVTVTSVEDPEIFATATVTVNEPAPQPIPVTGISITPETAEIEVGETVGFTAVIEPADADNQDVIWTVSDETIATVDENGTVTGVAAGTVTVTVTSAENAELFATAEVTVTEEVVPELNDLDRALNIAGGTIHFTNDATYPWIVLTEGDREYAKSGNGGVASSTSTITTTVTAAEGDLVIFDYKAWGEGSSDSYDWDKCRFYIDGNIMMDYGAHQNDWESFTAILTAGTHTLTWTYKKDSSVNPTGDYFAVDNVYVGEPYDVTVTFVDGTDDSVISTLEVAWGTVLADSDFPEAPEHEGLEFVGWNYHGEPITSDITIVARYRDPNAQTAIVILNVPEDVWGDGSGYQMLIDADATAYGTIIPTSGGLTSSGNAPAGVYEAFEYKIPENADGDLNTQNIIVTGSISIEVPGGIYDWCITNPTPGDRVWIASANGSIPGRYDDFEFEAGNIYEFIVTFGGQNDQVDLNVTPMGNDPVTGVTIDPTSAEITVGGTQQFTATVLPASAANKNVTWSVSDNSIITVNDNGLVTAVAPGTATVTVTTVDGGFTATANVTVTEAVTPEGLVYGFYFETDPIAEGWQFVDADGDGYNWGWNLGDGSNLTPYEGEGVIYSASYDNPTNSPLTPDNWAISPAIALPAGTMPYVTFYAAGQDPFFAQEHFQVYAGTSANVNEMTAISEEFVATGEYLQYQGNLNAFAGQTVYVAIRHFNVTDMFRLKVDQFEVFAVADDAIVENGSMNLYPNPTSGNVKIEAEGMNHITVFSVLGQVVYDAQVEGNETMLNMAQFNAGVYVVRVNTVNGIMTKRVTVVK